MTEPHKIKQVNKDIEEVKGKVIEHMIKKCTCTISYEINIYNGGIASRELHVKEIKHG